MVNRLDQVSLADFIEICAGNYTAVGHDETIASKLIADYNEIVNEREVKSKIADMAVYEKARCKLGLLAVCKDLITMFNDVDKVRECFEIAKFPPQTDKKAYLAFIEREMAAVRLVIKRWEKNHENGEKEEEVGERNVRSEFSSQIASLMAFFKMSIDLNNTNAMVYAHLVAQAHKQSDEMQKSLKKK